MRRRPTSIIAPLAGAALTALTALTAPALACPADWDGSGIVDAADTEAFITAHAASDPATDLDADGLYTFFDVLDFLAVYDTGCLDSDGDRLIDAVETNTGVYLGPMNTGTDPNLPDTDDDGLTDGDEVLGTTAGLDLPSFGVNPLRRDILVEIDWLTYDNGFTVYNFRPPAGAIPLIEEAFADAPLPNPDGTTGVNIILDYGQGGAFTGANLINESVEFVRFDTDFNAYKAVHFDPRRNGYFHYCLSANRYNSPTNGSTGVAELFGDDFMVTLYTFVSSYNWAVLFTHEIGHNLGLRHGGFENRNYKPNYNSVMNYRYTFPGVDADNNGFGNGVITFSRGVNPPLDERVLLEAAGVDGATPIDWNNNGVLDAFTYERNINCPPGETQPCGVLGGCADSSCRTNFDYDDWSFIDWSGRLFHFDRLTGQQRTQEFITCEPNRPTAP